MFRQLQEERCKFPPELRYFALTLKFYSSSAYNYVRSIFDKALPHPRTLTKWYSAVDGYPEYIVEAIKVVSIKVKVEKEKGKRLVAALIMDEMSIRELVEYSGTRQHGYIDLGTGLVDSDALTKAKNALVFMLVVLNSHWKVPIAYFLIDSLSAEEKANLVKGCLIQMHDTGIIIKLITFYGFPANISMCVALEASLYWPNLQTYFLHPISEEKVHIILDPCHILKLCRNTLDDWGFLYDGENNIIS